MVLTMEDEINGKEKAYSGRDRCEASAQVDVLVAQGRQVSDAVRAIVYVAGENLPSGAIFQLNQMAFRVLANLHRLNLRLGMPVLWSKRGCQTAKCRDASKTAMPKRTSRPLQLICKDKGSVIRFRGDASDGDDHGCEGDFGKEGCCAAERRGTRTA